LHLGQGKRDWKQDALPVQRNQYEFQEHLEAVDLRSAKLVGLTSRTRALDEFQQPGGHVIHEHRLELSFAAFSGGREAE
jgi:hypothetical protein